MGYGYWTRDSFVKYSEDKGRKVDASGRLDAGLTDQDLFRQRSLHPALDPRNVIRECCDTGEHPETIPVILALDVTGSMGPAAAETARTINDVMTRLYGRIKDVEFMVMGIGDLSYDRVPIQMSQFESDIRIAEQMDQVFLEYGGGGNCYESYTAAWYMGLYHTRLDCWKRNQKGLIITLGDEPLNPYLPQVPLARVTGDSLQGHVETKQLYQEASKKFNICHIHVQHGSTDHYQREVIDSFGSQLKPGCLKIAPLNRIADVLTEMICSHVETVKAGRNERKIGWKTGTAETDEKKNAGEKPGLFGMVSW